MKYRKLGRTELAISELGFGALEIGRNWPYWRKDKEDFIRPDDAEAKKIIFKALDEGINFFDTAPAYQDSERILGNALKGNRKNVILATKCGEWFDGTQSIYNYSYSETKKFIENSLRLLQTDYIDLLQIHSANAEIIQHGETVRAMKEAQQSGKIRYLGFSTEFEDAVTLGIESGDYDAVQISHNALRLSMMKNIFPVAKKNTIGIIVKDALSRGQLTSKKNDVQEKDVREKIHLLEKIAEEYSMSLTELAVRFSFSAPEVSTVIIGTKKIANLESNISYATNGILSEEILNKIYAING